MANTTEGTLDWAVEWLDGVASGASTMSQRKLTTIEKRGDLESVKKIAEAKGVHLLLLKDDTGTELVAASKEPFRVIC